MTIEEHFLPPCRSCESWEGYPIDRSDLFINEYVCPLHFALWILHWLKDGIPVIETVETFGNSLRFGRQTLLMPDVWTGTSKSGGLLPINPSTWEPLSIDENDISTWMDTYEIQA